jgi:hypothetical protein
MILEQALSKSKAAALAADPVLFVQAFDREPWEYQRAILHQALACGTDGKFKHRIVIISTPRQNGKSTISAWSALWRLYTDDNQEIVSVANDKDQASIILNDARRIISRSDVLYAQLDQYGLTRNEIKLKNGNRWIIKSADSVSSRGLRPSVICYDELGWAPDRALFDTLSAAQAAQSNPLILVTSTVGPLMSGPLWDLFELARMKAPGVLLIYHQENLSPLIMSDYLEREQALLPAHVYAREHLNRWGEGEDNYCSEQDWQRAIADGDPRRTDDPGPTYAYCDLGWVHDETVIAVVKKTETEKTSVLAMETFKGSHDHPVEFAAVEGKIIDLSKRLHVNYVRIESPQGVGSAQRLNLAGVASEVVYPTAKSNQAHYGALYTALKNGTVILPNDAKLRLQLRTLTIKTTHIGWRVEDVPGIHNDRVVAIAGALHLANERASSQHAILWAV